MQAIHRDLPKMHKKMVSFILLSAFLFSVILGPCMLPKVFATPETIYVYQGQSIQAAIDAANQGDIIRVASGVYNENLVVNKNVSLIGENPSNTIIDGSGTGRDVVVVASGTNNTRIEGFTIQKGDSFIESSSLVILYSWGHTIINNIIRQSDYGLEMLGCNDSKIINNLIINNAVAGIHLRDSSNRNSVLGNNIEKNSIGVWIADDASRNNMFLHNNFIDNPNDQARIRSGANFWDNGAEGNYWSDYKGQDLNGDGIGETSNCAINSCIPVHSLDWHPLIELWSEIRNFQFDWNGVTYYATVRCNSTVASFNFTYSLAQIGFNMTGPRNAVSFCNVTIDKSFLDGNFTVMVDKASRSYVPTSTGNNTSLYFTFKHSSTRKIQIRGTKVVGNAVPIANFAYSPTNPMENQEIQFNDTSTDPDGTVVAWSWNLGDGNTSNSANLVHKYMKGTYDVTLTVTDNEGVTNTLTRTIVVTGSSLDYTLYYVLVGIVAGALILGISIFLLKKQKKPFSSGKLTK